MPGEEGAFVQAGVFVFGGSFEDDGEMKHCQDCKYVGGGFYPLLSCFHPELTVTGRGTDCEFNRRLGDCGTEAKYFEQNERQKEAEYFWKKWAAKIMGEG